MAKPINTRRTGTPNIPVAAAPYYENRISLADFPEQTAAEMRRGTWAPVSEACLLFKDLAAEDPAVVTILHWGEPDGLLDTPTLAGLPRKVQ